MLDMTPRSRAALGVLLLAAGVGVACAPPERAGTDRDAEEPGGGEATSAVYPGDTWDRADAAELGFDATALDEIAARAERSGSNCLVVTRGGQIVADWYWNGTDASSSQEVFSASKSVTSTLVGIAQADGDLDIGDRAAEYIPDWRGTPSEDVTIENLLANDSGREWSLDIDYRELIGSGDKTGFAVALGQDEAPGTTWAYNNSAIQALDAVMTASTGQDTADYAAERLFAPLGMEDSEMARDAAGNTLTFMGVQSTCEDLARFGYLFLRDGWWGDTQVVPEGWVTAATGQPSQELSSAYGYLWWLNRPGPAADPTQAVAPGGDEDDDGDQMVPAAPEDMYWALGLGGQIVSVDPGSETVVVRLGPAGPPEGEDGFGTADAAAVVTTALVDP
jgi:CubicO group peptidase (beta-lactamase class C family)